MTSQMQLFPIGDRKMCIVENYQTTSIEWGPLEVAEARALREKTVTNDNESLLRTFHPALAHAELVFILTKKNGSKAWVATNPDKNYAHARGRQIHEQPYFESPAGQGRKYLLTIPDPLAEEVTIGVSSTREEQELIWRALPESVGVTFYPCECAIVFFKTRAAMLRAWAAGTPNTLGGFMCGYLAIED